MSSVRLFSILAIILAVAVAAGILISLKEGGPPTTPLPATEPVTATPSPGSGPSVDEPTPAQPDLSTSHPRSREDVSPLYAALQRKVETYKTVHVRTRLEFPLAARDQTVESEFWFDAIRPQRFIHKAFKSVPKDKRSMSPEFVPLPNMCEIYDGSRLTVISYLRRNVHKVDLTATDFPSKSLVASMNVLCATRLANPLQDLLFGVPYEERLKEMLEAKEVNTSAGQEVHVLTRITGEMSRVIQRGKLSMLLPVSRDGLKMLVLREDIFSAETGELVQSVYLDAEWHAYLIQSYPEIVWDADIPADRFVPDAPPGSTTHDMNEQRRRTHRLGITQEDLEEYRRAGNPMSASSILDLKRMKEREKGLEPSN